MATSATVYRPQSVNSPTLSGAWGSASFTTLGREGPLGSSWVGIVLTVWPAAGYEVRIGSVVVAPPIPGEPVRIAAEHDLPGQVLDVGCRVFTTPGGVEAVALSGLATLAPDDQGSPALPGVAPAPPL